MPTAKFCSTCGRRLSSDADVPARSPESYTPKHLAEKILTSKAALEGERKQVTILFADVKGSMEMLAGRDPEDARSILDPVLELMMEAVHYYEGTVNQVMGDGIMALFGAPLAHEDHATRACFAALRMQQSLKEYAETVRKRDGILVQIRAGLHCGEVVVRSIGSDLHMDYTAVGETTHLAARLEQLSTPGSVLISANVIRLSQGYIDVRALGPMNIKGLGEPIDVYELIGTRTVRSRFETLTARGLTKFVGRTSELELLDAALKRARLGRGQITAVIGDPGVGKSRLFWEFTRSHRTEGCLVLETSSISYDTATGYLAVIELLKRYFQIHERDDAHEIRHKVTQSVLALDPALAPTLPALLALLDVVSDDAEWLRLDPPQRRRQTLDAVKRLFLRESDVRPLVLVFEDLHWSDSETQALLDHLVDALAAARILLLVNHRAEYQHPWGGKSYYTPLRIQPLRPDSAEELLRALLGDDTSLVPLKRLLIAQAEGTPLFLEESVRALLESHVLVGDQGACRLTKPMPTIKVPPTVKAVLAARIDRLPMEQKKLLQTAAVIGRDVPYQLLHAIIEGSEEELRHGLRSLQDAEFLYEAGLFPDMEYTFSHTLIHEVAYGSLLHHRQRALHANIVAGIEALAADALSDRVERLAHHAFRGELWDKAFSNLRLAGARALSRTTFAEAAARFEQALVAVSHLPETRATLEHAIDVRFELRHALFHLGQPERGLACLREAERLARRLDDRRRLGWVSAYMSYYLLPKDVAESLMLARNACAIAAELSDPALYVAASYYAGLACYNRGDYRDAADAFRNAIAQLEGDLRHQHCGLTGFPVSMCASWLAISLANLGALDEAIASGVEGLRLAETLDHPYTLIVACRNLASVRALRGEYDSGSDLLGRALALASAREITDLMPGVMARLGYTLARSGRVTEGLVLLREAVSLNESTGQRGSHSLLVAYLSEACALAGRIEDALRHATLALAHAREHGERGEEAYALCLKGEVASRVDGSDPETVASSLARALALAEQLGMRPLAARCHLGLGALWERAGKSSQARAHFAAAEVVFREIGVPESDTGRGRTL